jgi:hypothetical protein
VAGCFFGTVILIAGAINFWGAAELRQNGGELAFVTILGAATIVAAIGLSAWLGISYCLDAIDRQNPAALISICAVMLSSGLIYSGSSVGEGPSYSNNLFCMALGFTAFFAAWLLLEFSTEVSRSICEERDPASGIRFAGWALATALVLGRALAGDWHSEQDTLHDFLEAGWPIILLSGVAIFMETMFRPSWKNPFPKYDTNGLFPALLYLSLAFVWLWHLGWWEGMQK